MKKTRESYEPVKAKSVVHNIMWAVERLEENYAVRRQAWYPGCFVESDSFASENDPSDIYLMDQDGDAASLSLEDLTIADWELYE